MSLLLQKEPPPVAHSWPEVPGELERIVRKALCKDKEERYQTIKDLLIDLKNLRKELELEAELERSSMPMAVLTSTARSSGATAHYPPSAEYIITEIKQHKRAVVLILGVIILSAFVLYLYLRPNSLSKVAPLGNATFTQLTDQSGPEYFPSLSPNASHWFTLVTPPIIGTSTFKG